MTAEELSTGHGRPSGRTSLLHRRDAANPTTTYGFGAHMDASTIRPRAGSTPAKRTNTHLEGSAHVDVPLKSLAVLLECKAERDGRNDLEDMLLEVRGSDDAAIKFVVIHAAALLGVPLE